MTDPKDDEDEDLDQFPLPAGLLKAAGIETDEDADAVPEATPLDNWARNKRAGLTP